jgi:AcrR family transcriptional regulator
MLRIRMPTSFLLLTLNIKTCFSKRNMTKKLTRKQLRSRTDQRILDSALKEFAQSGYLKASIANIAKGAHVSNGLVIHNFVSKKDLLLRLSSCLSENLYSDPAPEGALWKDVFLSIVRIVKAAILDPEKRIYFEFYYAMMNGQDTPEEVTDVIRNQLEQLGLIRLIEEGQKKGEIIAGDPTAVYLLFWCVLDSVLILTERGNLPFPSDEWFLEGIEIQH